MFIFGKIKTYIIATLALALPIIYVIGRVRGSANEKNKVLKDDLQAQQKATDFIKRWQSMKTPILVIVSLLLSGCAGTVYRTKLDVYCPPIAQYSKEWNEELATELDTLPQDYTTIPMAITDYVKLRDRIRACETEKGKL